MANKFTISTTFAAIDHMTGPIQKINAKVDAMGKSIERVGKSMQERFGAIGGALKNGALAVGAAAATASVAVFKLATHAQEAADSVVDTATSLGIGTRALQEYRYVAKLSGMETSDMDAALKKLTVNLGKGSDATEAALGKLGLTVSQMKAASPDQVLELIATGMQGVTDNTERAAIVTELFGKSSTRMVNALASGADGIAKLRREAEASGYVMDEAALSAGTKMGDAMDRLGLAAEGAANKIGLKFVPVMEKAAATLTDYLQKQGTHIADSLASMGGVFESTFGAILPVVDALLGILKPVFDMVGKIMTGLQPVFRILGKFLSKIIPMIGALAELIGEILAPAFEVLAIVLEPVFDILGLVFDIITPVIKLLSSAVKGMVDLFKSLPLPVKAFLGVLSPIVGIPLVIQQAWGSIKGFFGSIWDGISAGANAVWQGMQAGFSAAASFVSGVWSGMVDGIIGLINRVIDGINLVGGLAGVTIQKLETAKEAETRRGQESAGAKALSASGVQLSSNPLALMQQTANIASGKTVVDVNFNNAPSGTKVQQSGKTAPGVKLNLGMAGGR